MSFMSSSATYYYMKIVHEQQKKKQTREYDSNNMPMGSESPPLQSEPPVVSTQQLPGSVNTVSMKSTKPNTTSGISSTSFGQQIVSSVNRGSY